MLLFNSLQKVSAKPQAPMTQGLFDAVEERALAIGGQRPLVNLARGKLFIQFTQTRDKGVKILNSLTEPESPAWYMTQGSAHYTLARYFALAKQPEKAERHFKAAIKFEPWYLDIYRDFGDLYFNQGALKDALHCYLMYQKLGGTDREVAARVEQIQQTLQASSPSPSH